VAGARVFLNASRFEDWGIAQMEALAAGTPLATVPTAGPNAALPLARELAPELVAGDHSAAALAEVLRRALELDDAARADYSARARRLLEPYTEESLGRRVADEVLPRLEASSRS
jgi:glycosyltransferase involved in cell wall biosynthesis